MPEHEAVYVCQVSTPSELDRACGNACTRQFQRPQHLPSICAIVCVLGTSDAPSSPALLRAAALQTATEFIVLELLSCTFCCRSYLMVPVAALLSQTFLHRHCPAGRCQWSHAHARHVGWVREGSGNGLFVSARNFKAQLLRQQLHHLLAQTPGEAANDVDVAALGGNSASP